MNPSYNITNSTVFTGWQGQANIRGTYDILKTCLGTIALLCWSSVCPNVPGLHSSRLNRARGKLGLFVMSILLPELVLLVAFGQLSDAWTDKKAFEAREFSGWGLRQCYFVNMGGLFVRFALPQRPSTGTEAQQQQPFPLNCKQLRYLVDMHYIELSPINSEDIEMRNKSDGITRAITIAQVLWFTISTLARAGQGLHITTLELTTLSLVLIMGFSALAWWPKPMDISHPIILECAIPLQTVVAGIEIPPNDGSRAHGSTPLSFYERREWFPNRVWASYLNILRFLYHGFRLPSATENSTTGPFSNRFPSTELRVMPFSWEVLPGVLTLAYSLIFMIAWDAYFPTEAEKILWRVSSVICVVYGLLGSGISMLDRHGGPVFQWYRDLWRRRDTKRGATDNATDIGEAVRAADKKCTRKKARVWKRWQSILRSPAWLRRMTNLSADSDPNLDVNLQLWIFATLLTTIYCFSRAYILIEDFIGLRRQPSNTYDTVNWGQYSILF